MKKLIIFIKSPLYVKWMLIKIFFLSAYYRFVILYRPFSKLAPKIGTNRYETPATSPDTDWQYVKKVAWAVPAICNRTPWESKCLVQALVAKRILNNKNINCTLYMGVRNSDDNKEMLAHAWLRVDDKIVTGFEGYHLFTVTGFYGDK